MAIEMNEAIDTIRTNLEERDLLEQLAEEAAELSQAALKLIRARGMSRNTTPTPEVLAEKDLKEEAEDVLICLAILSVKTDIINNPKWQRWVNRLERQL